MNSFIINLKEKGRGFSLSSELCALSQQPLPGPFLNRKGFAYAKIKIFRKQQLRPCEMINQGDMSSSGFIPGDKKNATHGMENKLLQIDVGKMFLKFKNYKNEKT